MRIILRLRFFAVGGLTVFPRPLNKRSYIRVQFQQADDLIDYSRHVTVQFGHKSYPAISNYSFFSILNRSNDTSASH